MTSHDPAGPGAPITPDQIPPNDAVHCEAQRRNARQRQKRERRRGADVVLTGNILDLSVHAKSRVGFTEISTKTRLAVQALNVADGSTIRMTLNGSGSDDEFWFDTEDVEALMNEVLADSFGKLIQDTTVENKLLRLKTK